MPAPAPDDHRPLRLVLDTNVVIAGLLWAGAPRTLLQRAIDGQAVALFSSPALIDELGRTLRYPKLARRVESFGVEATALVAQYAALVHLEHPARVPRVVMDDADDDHVIAAAVAARADLIVTGDARHLLPIGVHQGIAIVTPRDVLNRLNGEAVR